MPISITAPIGEAIERTGAILFKPFDLEKWFKLGFCAFLVQLGDFGSGGGGGTAWKPGGRGARHDLERFANWLADNLPLVLIIGLLVLVVGGALWITFLWLQARGRFMFLDGVVRDRGAVTEPWNEYRHEAGSLFRFSAVVSLVGFLLTLASLAIGLGLAWHDIDRDRFEGSALVGLIVGGGLLLVTVVGFGLIHLFLNDFVVPAMYKRRVGVMQAWRVVNGEILRAHTGTAALYVLAKIAIGIVSGLLTLTLLCGTLGLACCFLMIPYIGTVVLLPLLVFDRCFSLAFLRQLGPQWTLAAGDDALAAVPG